MKIFFLFFLLIFNSTNVWASDFLTNAQEDFFSPYNTSALSVVEIGTGLTLFTFCLKHEYFQEQIASTKPLGKSSKIGYFLGQAAPNFAYFAVMGTHYLLNNDSKSLERSTLMLKASLYSDAMTEILKRSFNEKRPNGGTLSFPSGHATSAFAFSSVVVMEHSLPLGIAANMMSAFVGFSRMNDNAHYLHDVVAGATVGTMYGVGLYYAQKNRENKFRTNSDIVMIIPIQKGLAGNYLLNF